MIQNTPPPPTQGQPFPELPIDNWVPLILCIAIIYGYWYLKNRGRVETFQKKKGYIII